MYHFAPREAAERRSLLDSSSRLGRRNRGGAARRSSAKKRATAFYMNARRTNNEFYLRVSRSSFGRPPSRAFSCESIDSYFLPLFLTRLTHFVLNVCILIAFASRSGRQIDFSSFEAFSDLRGSRFESGYAIATFSRISLRLSLLRVAVPSARRPPRARVKRQKRFSSRA